MSRYRNYPGLFLATLKLAAYCFMHGLGTIIYDKPTGEAVIHIDEWGKVNWL